MQYGNIMFIYIYICIASEILQTFALPSGRGKDVKFLFGICVHRRDVTNFRVEQTLIHIIYTAESSSNDKVFFINMRIYIYIYTHTFTLILYT